MARLSPGGLIKLFTAVVSWIAVVALVPVVPRALIMSSPETLEKESVERKRAEEALRLANALFGTGGSGQRHRHL